MTPNPPSGAREDTDAPADVLTDAQQVLRLSGVVKRPNQALIRLAQAVVDLSATLAARDAALQELEAAWRDRAQFTRETNADEWSDGYADGRMACADELARLRASLAPQGDP